MLQFQAQSAPRGRPELLLFTGEKRFGYLLSAVLSLDFPCVNWLDGITARLSGRQGLQVRSVVFLTFCHYTKVAPSDIPSFMTVPHSIATHPQSPQHSVTPTPEDQRGTPAPVITEFINVQDLIAESRDDLPSQTDIQLRVQDVQTRHGRLGVAGISKESITFIRSASAGRFEHPFAELRLGERGTFTQFFDHIRMMLGLERFALGIDSLWFRAEATNLKDLTAEALLAERSPLVSNRLVPDHQRIFPIWAEGEVL